MCPKVNILVEIQFIGYNNYTTEIEVTAKSSDIDLGIIELEEVSRKPSGS